MAAAVRQDLAQLMNSSGSHKDLAGKYRQILEKAIQLSGAEQLEALKAFVEATEIYMPVGHILTESEENEKVKFYSCKSFKGGKVVVTMLNFT